MDTLRQKIDNLIQDGINPRIPGVSIRDIEIEIPGLGPRFAIVYIPKSYYMVTLGGSNKFYARNNSGKYPDVC